MEQIALKTFDIFIPENSPTPDDISKSFESFPEDILISPAFPEPIFPETSFGEIRTPLFINIPNNPMTVTHMASLIWSELLDIGYDIGLLVDKEMEV